MPAAKWFKLFASCIVVQGKAKSVIYDLERSAFYELPNDVRGILDMARTMPIDAIKTSLTHLQPAVIDSFFDKFVTGMLGFYTEIPEAFPDLDLTWEQPVAITNSVIEWDTPAAFDLSPLIAQLDALGCLAVQLRLLAPLSAETLERSIIPVFAHTRITTIEIFAPYDSGFDQENWFHLLSSEPRVRQLVIYAAPETTVVKKQHGGREQTILYLEKELRPYPKEVIAPGRFTTNVPAFTEAQRHNLGLNQKIAIDRNGEIKNYIDHPTSFGNVHTDSLEKTIRQPAFREKWFIPNDTIEICRDCQYRYACVSNSDIRTENGLYYKTQSCSFDPYTNTWSIK